MGKRSQLHTGLIMSKIKKAIKKVSKAEGFQKLSVEQVEKKLNTFDYSKLPKPGKNNLIEGSLLEQIIDGQISRKVAEKELKQKARRKAELKLMNKTR